MLGEAGGAVDGLVIPGQEGHLGGCTALGTDGVIHLAVLVARSVLAVGPALPAADGLVLEALLGVEFLLTGGEGELTAAIPADQNFVFEHCTFPFWYFVDAGCMADLVFAPTLANRRVRS